MSSRVLTLTRDGGLVVIRGYRAAEAARGAGLRPTYSGSAGGWMLDASRLPELVAYLEYRNRRYTLDEERPAPQQAIVATPEPDDGLELW
jgi:hypothetical protein